MVFLLNKELLFSEISFDVGWYPLWQTTIWYIIWLFTVRLNL